MEPRLGIRYDTTGRPLEDRTNNPMIRYNQYGYNHQNVRRILAYPPDTTSYAAEKAVDTKAEQIARKAFEMGGL